MHLGVEMKYQVDKNTRTFFECAKVMTREAIQLCIMEIRVEYFATKFPLHTINISSTIKRLTHFLYPTGYSSYSSFMLYKCILG